MAKDLHSFIAELERDHPDDIIRVKKTVDPAKHEITAVMELLAQQRGRHLLGLFERPLNLKGQESDIPVLINAFATRSAARTRSGCRERTRKLPLSLAFSKMGLNPVPPGDRRGVGTRQADRANGRRHRHPGAPDGDPLRG